MSDKVAEYTPKTVAVTPLVSSSFNNSFESKVSKNNTFIITNIFPSAKSTNAEKKYLLTSGEQANQKNILTITELTSIKLDMDKLVHRKCAQKNSNNDILNDLQIIEDQNDGKSNDSSRINELTLIQERIDKLLYRKIERNVVNPIDQQTHDELTSIKERINKLLYNKIESNNSPITEDLKKVQPIGTVTEHELISIKQRVDKLLSSCF